MPLVKHFKAGTDLFAICVKHFMNTNEEKKNTQTKTAEPGDMDSFNQRNPEKSTESEDVKQKKDEGESYMDYNGNSEANAPARAREE